MPEAVLPKDGVVTAVLSCSGAQEGFMVVGGHGLGTEWMWLWVEVSMKQWVLPNSEFMPRGTLSKRRRMGRKAVLSGQRMQMEFGSQISFSLGGWRDRLTQLRSSLSS